ncbi:hypothetical protein [Thermoactinospora rubra]|uniref:hypothetical protein n=1 Tax=Thermoactinospora rubra TaxID=1088767 RepID=UPI000A107FB1|nr:hypothetical protein [Thermoactinospora rubra]
MLTGREEAKIEAALYHFTVAGNGVTAAMPLLFDEETGYLDKLLSMPIRRSSIILSRFVFQVGMNSAQVLVVPLVAVSAGLLALGSW